jgi:hypothetical protein
MGGWGALTAPLLGALVVVPILGVCVCGAATLLLCHHKYVCTYLWVCMVLCDVVFVLPLVLDAIENLSHGVRRSKQGVCHSFILVLGVSLGTVCYQAVCGLFCLFQALVCVNVCLCSC